MDLRNGPRFEVTIAPQRYDPSALNLEGSQRVILTSRVQARGWSFPYVDERSLIVGPGEQYIGGEIDFQTFVSHLEEWRLYPSGQFLLRMRPWEVADADWQAKTRESLETRERTLSPEVIGFVSFELLLFTVTEAYIFASRLVQEIPYTTAADVQLGLRGVTGYALASSEPSRPLYEPYLCPIDNPHFASSIALDVLISDPKAVAITAATSLYRQFRWATPPAPSTLASLQMPYYR